MASAALLADEAVVESAATSEGARPATSLKAAHRLALDRYDRGVAADRSNIEEGYSDLHFLSGDQWPEDAKVERADEGRPILTINRLPQFVKQITGDIRMSKPGMKAVAVDDTSDPATAKVIGGLLRQIESSSDAQAAYFRGVDSQVTGGIGHWRVISAYSEEDSFNQDLKIVGIRDGLGVIWDPDAQQPTREDAMWCFVPSEWTTAAFEAKFPRADNTDVEAVSNNAPFGWFGKDTVRLAEYWVKEPITRRLALLQTGETLDLTGQSVVPFNVARIEERPGFKICRYLMSGAEFVEGPETWPGRHIPIVPVLGEEIHLERETIRHGAIRFAKDPQRLYNYWRTAQTEQVALQPKAPWIGTDKNFAKYQEHWKNANRKAYPFLPYTPDETNGYKMPERSSPPLASTGITEGVMLAADDMKAATGIYDAGLGARSNETSGKAIMARQREGDIGSFVYFDNFSRAVRRTGKILIDLIPHFYDSERIVRILGDDGAEDFVPVNKPVMGPDGMWTKLHDLTTGKYDVVVDTGPSFTTRREEAREGMQAFMQAAPQAAPLVLDLFAKAQDWPFAEEIAERLAKMIPGNQPPDPQAMQMQQAQQEMQMRGAEAQVGKAEAEADASRAKAANGKVDVMKSIAELHAVATGRFQPQGPPYQGAQAQ